MINLEKTKGFEVIKDWLTSRNFQPFAYQEETWEHIINGKSGLVNAPTGSGKTFSVFLGSLVQFINEHQTDFRTKSKTACS